QADAGDGGRSAGADRAGRAARRVVAPGQQVEPVVERPGAGVRLGRGLTGRVAARVTHEGGVVHPADRPGAGEVDLLGEVEVGRVVRVVGVELGQGAEDATGSLVESGVLRRRARRAR